MFPRQKLYAVYGQEDPNVIQTPTCNEGYDQEGGAAGLSTIGDLLASAGKKIDDLNVGTLATRINDIKLGELFSKIQTLPLTRATKLEIFNKIGEALEQPGIATRFAKTFENDPKILERFDSTILNKLDPKILAKMDVKVLLAKLDPKVIEEIKKIAPPAKKQEILDNEIMTNIQEANKIFKEDSASLRIDVPTSSVAKPVDDATRIADDLKPSPLPPKKPKMATSSEVKAIQEKIPEDVAKAEPNPTATKVEAENVAKQGFAKWVSANKGYIVIAGVSISALAYGIYALDNFINRNNAPFEIIGMELDTKDPNNSIWFLYNVKEETQFQLTDLNWIVLETNDAVPKIPVNKIYKIVEVDNDKRKLKIFLNKEEMPTSLGKTGTFRYQTTYGNQLAEAANDVTDLIAKTGSKAAAGILDGFLEGIGVSKTGFFTGLAITVIVIVILIVIFMVLKLR
jgi:hypothetical protein